MLALKLLLTIAGVVLLAVAVGIPLYGVWIRIARMLKKRKRKERDDEFAPEKPVEIEWRRPAGAGDHRLRAAAASPRASWWCRAGWAACASAR